MKKKFICFAILILTAYILLYPADAVNASRNGLMLWYEKVLPTLLPFAIISNVLIHSGYMDALTKHLTKYFRLFCAAVFYSAFQWEAKTAPNF